MSEEPLCHCNQRCKSQKEHRKNDGDLHVKRHISYNSLSCNFR